MAIKADDRLIVALDFHTMEDVKALVEKLGDSVSYYKVGMELFYSVGGEVVRWLRGQGKHVFLDLKLHDIPNTVAGGLCSLMDLGADILNVHASGGYTMMKTAADRLHAAAEEQGIPCRSSSPSRCSRASIRRTGMASARRYPSRMPSCASPSSRSRPASMASSRRRRKQP